MTTASAIIDLESTALTAIERDLIQHPAVAGIILFSRNYHDPQQLKALNHSIKSINSNLIIMVDQEGGRVQRFVEGFTRLPAMTEWGHAYAKDAATTLNRFSRTIDTMLKELQSTGVDMTLAPVLDVNHHISTIIGERSFSEDPDIIITLAKTMITVFHNNNMPATGKHFPGHGAVIADSHKDLPIDARPYTKIETMDLLPFKALISQLDAIMPAHIVFPEVDSQYPASFSPVWLRQILREQLKFNGVIISDDLSMEAAATIGNYQDRALLSLESGCDLVTICNNQSGAISAIEALEKWHQAESALRIKGLINGTIHD